MLEEELTMSHLSERIHAFVEKNIVANDPHPEYSWLDKQSGIADVEVSEQP